MLTLLRRVIPLAVVSCMALSGCSAEARQPDAKVCALANQALKATYQEAKRGATDMTATSEDFEAAARQIKPLAPSIKIEAIRKRAKEASYYQTLPADVVPVTTAT